MGVQIVRVPPGFVHPVGGDGDFIPGAHLEQLYYLSAEAKSAFQVYENVTEGTPQSPIFESLKDLESWLHEQGNDSGRIAFLVSNGHAPSLVVRR